MGGTDGLFAKPSFLASHNPGGVMTEKIDYKEDIERPIEVSAHLPWSMEISTIQVTV